MNILRDSILFCAGMAMTFIVQRIVLDRGLLWLRRHMGQVHGYPWKRISAKSTVPPHRYSTTRGTGHANWSGKRGEYDFESYRPKAAVTPRGRRRDN